MVKKKKYAKDATNKELAPNYLKLGFK